MAYYNQIYNPYYQYNNQNTQSNGFVPIANETDARNCPIQRGTSVTFRDENLPYIYIKTLGFGQLDSPVFEKYRLVKETPQNAQIDRIEEKTDNLPIYVTKSEFEGIQNEIEALKETVGKLRKELGDE